MTNTIFQLGNSGATTLIVIQDLEEKLDELVVLLSGELAKVRAELYDLGPYYGVGDERLHGLKDRRRFLEETIALFDTEKIPPPE